MSLAAPPVDGPIVVVLNAGSGRNDAVQARETIVERLQAAGREHRLELIGPDRPVSQAAADAVAWARTRAGVVVAAGGDGTLNAVAEATLGSGCAFGVLPQGTFNYFGRTHDIPQELEGSLEVLLEGRPEPVQVGRVSDARRSKVFLVNASLGLYPQLLEDREAFKSQFGRTRLVALASALVTLMREHRQLRLRVAWNADDPAGDRPEGDERRLRTPTLFVGNNRLQLEQIGIAEAPVLDSGQLVAIALKPVGTLTMLGLMLRGAIGRLGEADQVLSLALRDMTVAPAARYGPRRMKVATDGEIVWMQAPLRFGVAEEPLWLIRRDPPADAKAD